MNLKEKKKIILISIIFSLNLFNTSLFSLDRIISNQEYLQFFEQAEQFMLKGEFEKSIELFQKTLNKANEIDDVEIQCESLYKLGQLYWNLGQLKKSSIHYENSLELAGKNGYINMQNKCQVALEIYDLYMKGKDLRSLSNYQDSIMAFENAIRLARQIESNEHELKCLLQLSSIYWNLNKLKEFLSLNEKALSVAQSIKHKKQEGICLYNIGIYYWQLDDYSKALSYYEGALRISRLYNNKIDELDCLNNIGIIYKEIGNYDKALEYLEKTLYIAEHLKDDISISMALNNIGTIYRNRGLSSKTKKDFFKALSYFESCLELTIKTDDKITEVQALNNIGTIYTDIGNFSNDLAYYYDALKYFQSGYEKAKEINDEEAKSMTLTNIGIVHFNLENYEESAQYYENAINLALEIEGNKILWEAYLEIAKAYEKQNKINEAIENYKLSIDTTEKIRSSIILEELKSRFLGTDKRIEAYKRLIHLFVNQHQSEPDNNKHYEEAFNYLERAKARAFLDSIELSQVDFSQDVDAKLLNREKELMNDITQIHSKLFAAELSPEEKSSLSQNLSDLEDKLETLKREIRKESTTYASFRYPEIITLDETQNSLLDADTAIFAYSIGQENSYAFAVTKKELRIFPIPSRDEIQNQVSDYRRIIADKDNHNFEIGHELFNHLVFPGLDKDIRNIIFVPDGILHILPFETLLSNAANNNWLIRDYAIAYAPSISSLREIIKRKKSSKKTPRMDLLAFGDPSFGALENGEDGGDIFQDIYPSRPFNFYRLEFSGVEIDHISSLFKKSKRNIFRRKEATEDQVKTHKLDDYKIIHFATHSIIDERNPDISSIVLTLYDDLPEDGLLQMREVYTLNLNSDLVTLSSCQTGLGEFIRGEGIVGINRAFFYAGASSVLMSLWAINDQASYQLMERFYTHLRSSNSIMDALRKAKLEMIESDVLSHPYYWAGFIASGKTDEVIFQSSLPKWIIFGIIFALVFGATFILARRFSKKA